MNTVRAMVVLGDGGGANQYRFTNLCSALNATMDSEIRKSVAIEHTAATAMANTRTALPLLTPIASRASKLIAKSCIHSRYSDVD